ncbi:hypothetical protein FOS14_02600 [Skermania sp. ID1734]|uniref:hypothetical protein n=1 Tax=Skermania sp. ID1734 TaxID=2597516 RepID=UPI00117E9025|nr:hypothetical protein [Skermania sp. ID1734]TSE01461.1 hypothetical protein FOS14_02600 [Skermania sp. ID1734]
MAISQANKIPTIAVADCLSVNRPTVDDPKEVDSLLSVRMMDVCPTMSGCRCGQPGDMGQSPGFEITVAVSDLAALILAVHAASNCSGSERRKWKYGNVVGIAPAYVDDIEPEVAARRYHRDALPMAAISVVQQPFHTDVLFDRRSAGTATAYFNAVDGKTAWTTFLADATIDNLDHAGVGYRVDRPTGH